MTEKDNRFVVSVHRRMINSFKVEEIRETICDLREAANDGELYTTFNNPKKFVLDLRNTMDKGKKHWQLIIPAIFLSLFALIYIYAIYRASFFTMTMLVAGWSILYLLWGKEWLLLGTIKPPLKETKVFIFSQLFVVVGQFVFLFFANKFIPTLVFGDADPLIIITYVKYIRISFIILSVVALSAFFCGYIMGRIVWFSGGVLQSVILLASVTGWYRTWMNVEILHFAPETFFFPMLLSSIISILWFLLFIKIGREK